MFDPFAEQRRRIIELVSVYNLTMAAAARISGEHFSVVRRVCRKAGVVSAKHRTLARERPFEAFAACLIALGDHTIGMHDAVGMTGVHDRVFYNLMFELKMNAVLAGPTANPHSVVDRIILERADEVRAVTIAIGPIINDPKLINHLGRNGRPVRALNMELV